MEVPGADRAKLRAPITSEGLTAKQDQTTSAQVTAKTGSTRNSSNTTLGETAAAQALMYGATEKQADPRSSSSVAGALIDRKVKEKAKQSWKKNSTRSKASSSSGISTSPSGKKPTGDGGHTLSELSQRHGTSLLDVVAANPGASLSSPQQAPPITLPEEHGTTLSSRLDARCTEVSTYEVKPGDSLWRIAESQLGDPNRWPEVYALNRAEIDRLAQRYGCAPSPTTGYAHWIFPGEQLALCLPPNQGQTQNPERAESESAHTTHATSSTIDVTMQEIRHQVEAVARKQGIEIREPGWISKEDLQKLIPYAVGALAAAGLLYGLSQAAQARLAAKALQELAKLAGSTISLDQITRVLSRLITDETGGIPGDSSRQEREPIQREPQVRPLTSPRPTPPAVTPSGGPPSPEQKPPSMEPRPPSPGAEPGYSMINVQPPHGGPPIRCADRGSAQVPIDKVEKFGAGKSQEYPEQEHRELRLLKQTRRKEFDSNPANEERLRRLNKLKHNHERSQAMAQAMRDVGLNPDAEADLRRITEHLLDVGQSVNDDNCTNLPSELDTPAGKLKILSTWKKTDDGKWYLSTLTYIPKLER